MKQFFLHETTVNKMLVADWKTFNIFGNLGKFCASTSSPMYLVLFSDFQNIWICYWKRKKISPFPYPVLLPEICNIWFFFKSWIPQIYQTVEMDEDKEGAYIFMLQNWIQTFAINQHLRNFIWTLWMKVNTDKSFAGVF